MKIEKNKHDHSLTSLLKTAIFAMLMIAPLFASCSQLMYVTFNKNAYQSTQITGKEYYTTYEYETNEVNSVDDLVEGRIYHAELSIADFTSLNNYDSMTIYAIYNLKALSFESSFNTFNETFYNVYKVNTDIRIARVNNGEINIAVIQRIDSEYSNIAFDFVYKNKSGAFFSALTISESQYLGERTVNERSIQALDNAFYYGVEKMTQSPLFNWTQNTALYTGIKAMTDNLQVQTNVIAVLVTYWTILTIIYIIIDIVLSLFTKLTHMIVRSD